MKAPSPRSQPGVGHLGRWGREPLALLEEGALLGPVFGLRLWRSAIVGYSPDWNRLVLGDLDLFRSGGSMSGLSPHLNAGIVQTESPDHRGRRAELNPPFARGAVTMLRPRILAVLRRRLPDGPFEAAAWSSMVVREILASAFFGDILPLQTLSAFLRPLDRRMPAPLLRRPVLFGRMNNALDRALWLAPPGCVAAAFREVDGGRDELRVALSAGYDTTAHTLAWLLYHVAAQPRYLEPELARSVVDEVLRLYPAGWLGSRRAARDTSFEGIDIAEGTLVLYSPYLTHRHPGLWPAPVEFRPERFAEPLPPWGFLPFAGGERSCLGRFLARLILDCALEVFGTGRLILQDGNPQPRAGITLAPTGPLNLMRRPG